MFTLLRKKIKQRHSTPQWVLITFGQGHNGETNFWKILQDLSGVFQWNLGKKSSEYLTWLHFIRHINNLYVRGNSGKTSRNLDHIGGWQNAFTAPSVWSGVYSQSLCHIWAEKVFPWVLGFSPCLKDQYFIRFTWFGLTCVELYLAQRISFYGE